MWTVGANELFAFRAPGGDRFTALVDDIVRTHAALHGLPLSNVLTNVRTNKPDGGVDSEVRLAVPADDSTFMDVPTCWQYKAMQGAEIHDNALKKELNKPYAKELLLKGYGYRLCVCDDFPPQTATKWEALLTAEARAISQAAPPARVLNASALAAWLTKYKGLVLKHFRPHLAPLQHIEAWGQRATAITKQYVSIAEWESVVIALSQHCDFTQTPQEPVLCVQAQPGTGKSRAVYELLRARPQLHGIVVYTDSPAQALALARSVLNDPIARLVLVADECPVDSRVALNDLLMATKERCRVICIDNSFERPPTGSAEYQLAKMPPAALEEILRLNFPEVQQERRHAYVEYSDGYVRFASDLCKNDPLIAAKGGLEPAFGNIRGYLRTRLRDDYDYVSALALLTKLGCAGGVRGQITAFAIALGLDEASMRRSLDSVKEQIGFVVRTPDYYYVTPDLVAQICFSDAYARWVQPNVEYFLGQLEPSLLDSFQKRVARSGAREVRQTLSGFFRRWAERLKTAQLLNEEAMLRLEVLVNTDPDAYLPVLAALIENAPALHLPGVADEWEGNKVRRRLVWLAERLASFPEYFHDAERILLKLALHESERSLGNSASNIWRQLFRIALSGTAVSFNERQALLRQRIFSDASAVSSLALSALNEVFNIHAFKVAGPSTVAGRIVPRESRPSTYAELHDRETKALDLLADAARSDNKAISSKAIDILLQHVRHLLGFQHLNLLRSLITPENLSTAQLPQLLEGIDHYLRYDAPKVAQSDYAARIAEWAESLIPRDFHGSVVSVIGKRPWHHFVDDDKKRWDEHVAKLAQELVSEPQLLDVELPWLCSPEARSAGTLGQHMGRLDQDARVLMRLLESAAATGYTSLAQGYVQSLLQNHPHHEGAINDWLNANTTKVPLVARDIAFAGFEHVDIVNRLDTAIRAGVWSPDSLRGLAYGGGTRGLEIGQLRQLLALITDSSDQNARRAGLELLAYRMWLERQESLDPVLSDSASVVMIWKLVESLIADKESDSYRLFEVIKSLETIDTPHAASVAARGLISDSFGHQEQAEQLLADMASRSPDVVMALVGEAALDADRGWFFNVGKYRRLMAALPPTVVINWLQRTGVRGAQRIARHLPPPFLDQNGKPALHPLTAYVLKEFETDDTTFSEFCAGVHNLQMYSGDIAHQYEQEAAAARLFLGHELRRVREWARYEERTALERAQQFRKDEQERWLE